MCCLQGHRKHPSSSSACPPPPPVALDARLPPGTSSQFTPPRPSEFFLGGASAPPFLSVESSSGCRRRWQQPR
eukprot:2511788-Pyramimonas_sp.AAC.1